MEKKKELVRISTKKGSSMRFEDFLMYLSLSLTGSVVLHRGRDVGIVNDEKLFMTNGIVIDKHSLSIVYQNAERYSDLFSVNSIGNA